MTPGICLAKSLGSSKHNAKNAILYPYRKALILTSELIRPLNRGALKSWRPPAFEGAI